VLFRATLIRDILFRKKEHGQLTEMTASGKRQTGIESSGRCPANLVKTQRSRTWLCKWPRVTGRRLGWNLVPGPRLEPNAHGDRNDLGVKSSGRRIVITRLEIKAVTGLAYLDCEANSSIRAQGS
jgi:hypothetical protein